MVQKRSKLASNTMDANHGNKHAVIGDTSADICSTVEGQRVTSIMSSDEKKRSVRQVKSRDAMTSQR